MKKNKSIICLSLIMLLVLTITVGCGNKEDQGTNGQANGSKVYELKVGHTGSITQPYHNAMIKAAELIKERTSGAVILNVYPDNQLGAHAELLELLEDGTLDIAMSAAAPISAYVPRVALTELPFLFDSREHVYAFYDDDELMKKVWAGTESIGRIVAFYENGFRDIGSVGFAIKSPKDVKGKKMRIMSSRAYILMADALDMLSTTIPSGEVYTALQTGTVEIVDSPPPIFSDWAWSEVITDFTLTDHGYSSTPIVISNLVEGKIGSENYNIVVESIREITEFAREEALNQYEDGVKRLKDAGINVHVLTSEKRAEFVELMKKSWDIFIDEVGDNSKEIIDEIRAMVE